MRLSPPPPSCLLFLKSLEEKCYGIIFLLISQQMFSQCSKDLFLKKNCKQGETWTKKKDNPFVTFSFQLFWARVCNLAKNTTSLGSPPPPLQLSSVVCILLVDFCPLPLHFLQLHFIGEKSFLFTGYSAMLDLDHPGETVSCIS